MFVIDSTLEKRDFIDSKVSSNTEVHLFLLLGV